jgi:hypothetical protein
VLMITRDDARWMQLHRRFGHTFSRMLRSPRFDGNAYKHLKEVETFGYTLQGHATPFSGV